MKRKKVIVYPVFHTKEQEETFARCARYVRDSMSTDTRLVLEDEIRGNVIVHPVFKTKEQEELFAKCAKEVMLNHMNSELQWEGKKKVLKNNKRR